MSEKTHSSVGASSCERWWNCPGSVELLKQYPNETSKYAAEGQVAHDFAEAQLKACLYNDPTEALGWDVDEKVEDKESGKRVTIKQEMVDAVNMYTDYIMEQVDAYDLHPHQVLIEQHLVVNEKLKLFGTSDCTIHVPFHHMEVVDFKYGAGVVVAIEGNKQLKYYALGAVLAMSDWDRENTPYVKATICQPRAQGAKIKTAWYPMEDILAFLEELIEAVQRTEEPDAPLNAGDWCSDNFCAARHNCAARASYLSEAMEVEFSEIPKLPAQVKAFLPQANQLTTEQLLRIYAASDDIKAFLADVHNHIFGRARTADPEIPFKVVDSEGRRRWISPTAAIEELEPVLGQDIYEKKSILSPNQIEELVKRVNRARPKDDKLTVDISHLYEKPITGEKLVALKPGETATMSEFDGWIM